MAKRKGDKRDFFGDKPKANVKKAKQKKRVKRGK